MCQGIMQHRRELMQIFIGFRARHRKLRPKDIKGRICLVVIEDEQQFVGHRRQFAFATTAWFAPARSGLEPFFIRFLLRCLVDVAEDRQQVVELGLGQAGQGFHLTLVSDLHAHWLASSMAFWRTVYLSLYWGTTLMRRSRVFRPSGTARLVRRRSTGSPLTSRTAVLVGEWLSTAVAKVSNSVRIWVIKAV